MRRLLALVVVCLVLLFADNVARGYAGNRIEDQIAAALELGDEPDVSIGGFPFLWGLLRGRLEEVTVSSDSVGSDEVVLSDVRMTLTNVRFSTSQAISGNLRQLEVGSSRGEAVISAPALRRALSRLPTGLLTHIPEGHLDVEGSRLNLGVTTLQLPVISQEMQYESAEVVNGEVRLVFSLNSARLNL